MFARLWVHPQFQCRRHAINGIARQAVMDLRFCMDSEAWLEIVRTQPYPSDVFDEEWS